MIVIHAWLGTLLFLTWGQKPSLLLVGDSHIVGPIGERLQTLWTQEFQVTRVGSCGAKAQSYFNDFETRCGFVWLSAYKNIRMNRYKTPRIKTLTQNNPDVVVIHLGTNFLGLSESAIKKEVQDLVSALPSTSACHWIGPPDIRDRQKKAEIQNIDRILKETLSNTRCRYQSSHDLVPYPSDSKIDGIHYPQSAGQTLGDKIFERWKKQGQAKSKAKPGSDLFKSSPSGVR